MREGFILWVGSSLFSYIPAAIVYYEAYGYAPDEVRDMVQEGVIGVGYPKRAAVYIARQDREGRWWYSPLCNRLQTPSM